MRACGWRALAGVEAVRQRRLAAVRAASVALPLDEPVAERYGELLALARTERPTARVSDLLIIATAAATKRELYTLDVAQSRLAQAAGVPATTL